MIRVLLSCFLLFALPAAAQRLSYWNQSDVSDNQVFFSYENDFFTQRDRYYSQGISIAYKHFLKPDPTAIQPQKNIRTMGFTAEHQVFTPATISSDSALHGDCPYAAFVRGTFLFETRNPARKLDLGYSASFGFSGPHAMGREMQTAIHKATGNTIPQGWQYQLPASVLIDLSLYAKKQVYYFRKSLTINCFEWINVGTTNIDLSAGLELRYVVKLKNVSLVLYGHSAVRFVGYNGTLQGILFAPTSSVQVADSDVRRIVSEQEMGIRLSTSKWKINHWYRFQSPVFSQASAHSWGGVTISFMFGNNY